MTDWIARRGWPALAAIAALAAIVITVIVLAVSGRSPSEAFPVLHPAAAPASWPHLGLPNGPRYCPTRPRCGRSLATPTLCPPPGWAPAAGSSSTSTPLPGKAQSACRTGPPSGSGCCGPTTRCQPARSPLPKGSRFSGGHRIMPHRRLCHPDWQAPLRRDRLPGPGANQRQRHHCGRSGRRSAPARPQLLQAVASYLVR